MIDHPMDGGPKRGTHRISKPVGMREIAQALGISTGTVDRALHNKPGINAGTRRQVLEMAKTLGYHPNLAARYLSSRKHITIGVCLPMELAYFYGDVRQGILDAASGFEALGIRILHRPYQVLGQHEVEAIRDVLSEEISGLVISPGYPNQVKPYIEQAAKRGIPVLCVATDAPDTPRLSSVSVDPFVNGSLAGELMGQFLHEGSKVIVLIGMHATFDHAQKAKGFRHTFHQFCAEGKVVQVIEAHDDEEEAFSKCRRFLQREKVNGIYVSTANSLPVMHALETLGLAGHIKVIGTDLFPAMVPLLESAKIAATIHQRPREQGRRAFGALMRFITAHIMPPPQIGISPAIVMRSNLHLFLQQGSGVEADLASSHSQESAQRFDAN
ncbi:MAG TPA: LacI family DNA-binding transcriptional regulator [Terriglobia bacterium]|nr:LacI family DNA-binding transcriptional regulator [Terriglobia bacterium]